MHRFLLPLISLCLLLVGCSGRIGTPTPDAVARQMAINTRLAQAKGTAGVLATGTPEREPHPTGTESPAPAPSRTSSLEPGSLPPASMSGNLLENGAFHKLAGWEEVHTSPVPDRTTLAAGDNYVFWKRAGSGESGGSLGVLQSLELDVSQAKRLELCLDVWVGYHTLKNTGWFAEEHGWLNEMPVHIRVDYLDRAGSQQIWHHGFLITHNGNTTMTNFTLVPRAMWRHFCFNLLDNHLRRGPYGREILPPPVELSRIVLFGNGWDFKGAVGNAVLTVR